jgi:hypothetical protein
MGTPRGKIRRHDVIGGGIEFSIYGDTDKLKVFFTDIAKAPNGPSVDRELQMPQVTVKRYPSDPGYTRKATTRRYSPDTGIKLGTTPGQNFYCEVATLDVGTGKVEWDVTTFTHTGPILALRAYAKAKAKTDFRLRWASGRYEDLEPPGNPTTRGGLGSDLIPAVH